MALSSWRYFLSLERDFERTIDFVELAIRNSAAYSNEYAKLLLLIGSEVDVVAKMLCRNINSSSTAGNITTYQTEICDRFVGMHTIEIEISRYRMAIKPWQAWGRNPPVSPDWWKAYNNVKHERDTRFQEATQENVVGSLCGLLSLHLYLERDTPHIQPYPKLLEYSFPDYIVTSGGNKQLPGI